ncbi:hypothetical protein AVEN_31917-1 [Araneus ventricosus]|uniref:Uncharacterized protein n=1 Tax=Araneus ventricosus TaxID=182803 RepID=A0A4Y2IFZ6_ARAVE|nr:hypothetical protein AVEN_31917-1 [Araneus ventricosus]
MKVLNSQNPEDFKFAESNLTSSHEKILLKTNQSLHHHTKNLVEEIQHLHHFAPTEKIIIYIKMVDSLKALRSPEALKRPWDLQLPIPSLVQRSTQKKVPIVTENDSSNKRQKPDNTKNLRAKMAKK